MFINALYGKKNLFNVKVAKPSASLREKSPHSLNSLMFKKKCFKLKKIPAFAGTKKT